MKHPLAQMFVRWVVLALGVTIATKLLRGIHCDDSSTLIVVVLMLSFFNAILKPLLVLVSLPFIVMTMGLGIAVINAFLFLLVGRLVDGFHVDGFWWAMGGALIVSATNLIMNRFLPDQQSNNSRTRNRPPERKAKSDDVIDI